MSTEFKLGGRTIGASARPFVVAEMSGNHNQSLDRALAIVDAAAAAGADAIKIQTYTAETMTLDLKQGEFSIRDQASLWNGESLYQLYEKAHTPWDWHKTIFDRCRERGIVGFSSPFDLTAVDFLEKLNAPLYKIASFELTDLRLIERVARTGKPVIMSTGMATAAEIDEAVSTARKAGCKDLVLLKCTSTYPASPKNTHILTIPHMRELFGCQVGISDHTMGIGVSVAAVALGATFIERHFTLARADGGVDSAFSLEPAELKSLVIESERAWEALGHINYGPTEKEKPSLQFRRSVYASRDIREGELLSEENLRIIRPGHGLAPKFFPLLLGKRARRGIAAGTPMSWELI